MRPNPIASAKEAYYIAKKILIEKELQLLEEKDQRKREEHKRRQQHEREAHEKKCY